MFDGVGRGYTPGDIEGSWNGMFFVSGTVFESHDIGFFGGLLCFLGIRLNVDRRNRYKLLSYNQISLQKEASVNEPWTVNSGNFIRSMGKIPWTGEITRTRIRH